MAGFPAFPCLARDPQRGPGQEPSSQIKNKVVLMSPIFSKIACRLNYEIFNYHKLLENEAFLEFYNYIDSLFSLCQNQRTAAKELF